MIITLFDNKSHTNIKSLTNSLGLINVKGGFKVKAKQPVVSIPIPPRFIILNEDVGERENGLLQVYWNENEKFKYIRLKLILELANCLFSEEGKILKSLLSDDVKNFLDNKKTHSIVVKPELTI